MNGPLKTLASSRDHSRDGCAPKVQFYQHHLNAFGRAKTCIQLFCGEGGSVVATHPADRHVAVDIDGIATIKYRLKFPNHSVYKDNCIKWIQHHGSSIKDVNIIDADASGNPIPALSASLSVLSLSFPCLVFATYGYLGTSIRTKMNRERAMEYLWGQICDCSRAVNLHCSLLGRAVPLGGRIGQNHTIYMATMISDRAFSRPKNLPAQQSLL